MNEIFETGELTNSQKKGLVKILYKKNGRQFIKNYRPISLLQTDLKIISKVLAKRMAKTLPKIIHENQKCVKDRKITDNIHLVQDIIDLINKKDWEAICIMIDQEKAFDRISHNFIMKTLNQYGFGQNFIKWIKILYTDITSKVKVNGYHTNDFKIERGVRQGCPLSALLYVLCLEVLSTNIRTDPGIQGVKLNDNIVHKETTYVDDMTINIFTPTFEYIGCFKKGKKI